MPNIQLMRLYDSYLGPATDGLLDLGSSAFRWDNLYIRGTNSATTLSASSINGTILTINSARIVGLASTGITVDSGIITSLRFAKGVGSSLILNNSTNAYLNVNIMTHNAISTGNGDVWFRSSSNTMYLFIHSGGFSYSVAMGT